MRTQPLLKSLYLIHLISLFVLYQNIAIGQNFIYSKVLDSSGNLPLEFVTIHNKSNNQIVETNFGGEFKMTINSKYDTIVVTYLGYNRLTMISGDVKEIIILHQNNNLLDEIKISSNKTATHLNSKHVIPISIVSDDTYLYVLNNNKNVGLDGNYGIQIYNEFGILKETVKIDYSSKVEIIKNCRGGIYLKLGAEFILIDYIDDTFQMIEKINATDYYKLFGKCVGSFESSFMYELIKLNGLNKLYFVVDSKSDSFHIAKSIVFNQKIENYTADMGFIEYGENVSTMEITDSASNSKIRRAQATSFLLEKIIHKNNVNNFCFVYDSHFVLFNFDEGKMEWFDSEGKIFKTIESVEFLSSDQYKNLVLHDKLSGKFYTIKKLKHEYHICNIDLSTGNVNDCFSLNVAFFDSIEILNGKVFVLGRKNNIEFNQLYFKSLN